MRKYGRSLASCWWADSDHSLWKADDSDHSGNLTRRHRGHPDVHFFYIRKSVVVHFHTGKVELFHITRSQMTLSKVWNEKCERNRQSSNDWNSKLVDDGTLSAMRVCQRCITLKRHVIMSILPRYGAISASEWFKPYSVLIYGYWCMMWR